MYRKYLEPEYGKVAPEVEIMAPQVMDMNIFFVILAMAPSGCGFTSRQKKVAKA